MTPEQLRALLEEVAALAARTGELPDEAQAGPPAGSIFRPTDSRAAGVVADWVTPIAQRWAPELDLAPRELARVLARGLTLQKPVASVEVAPSGLIALTLEDAARAGIIQRVLDEQDSYALGGEPRREIAEAPGSRDPDDPVRAAQLAHARLCRTIRNAEAAGVERRPSARLGDLTHVPERHLLVALADLPQRLDRHAGDEVQQRRAVTDLAALADSWDHPVRPLTAGAHPEPVHGARLMLADATRVVLRNGLARLGAAAPERM
ncbi:DALR anticodon-binding domain-containing protein [Terrabacter carboxydivorans]|uniref:DALR anticodon binding domain-containing protein n=1 Tax=Terrabacter carboxydivorans TaxID=619730 RepID=A0ABP5Z4D9_9MICO